MVDQIQTPDWYVAMVFDRYSFRELGCCLVWWRAAYLVGRRTSLVAVAVSGYFCAGKLAVLLSRKTGKASGETESFEKQKAPSENAQVNNTLRFASWCDAHFSGNGVYQELRLETGRLQRKSTSEARYSRPMTKTASPCERPFGFFVL
jgi:hypothetical protein